MKPLSECRLYAFVDTAYLQGRPVDAVARDLCAGGADLVQLRAKDSTASEVSQMAEAILPVTRAAGVGLVINDHLGVARQLSAEFCHLGQEDFFDAGWYFDGGPYSSPFAAMLSITPETQTPGQVTAVRWQLMGDSVNFQTSLALGLEYGANIPNTAIQYSAVSFYYLDSP